MQTTLLRCLLVLLIYTFIATGIACSASVGGGGGGADPDDGLIGYGQTISITPDGSYWFIAGDRFCGLRDDRQVPLP